ncbi:hypothetical protein HQ865_10135 [Mucilaginibacter mali]|uniref:Uncharacterized protein n=1 Tax=Mucilaginibacter mali TaxID=2740462 RepID=A0A7D4UK58_9SPHI|nr:hypothetical protein [Mucilaginibacter mali]QKJ30102.1 hypothetical protein HQ865_10135 [Mucilaginibacter mali]
MKINMPLLVLILLSKLSFCQPESQKFKSSKLKNVHLSTVELKGKFTDNDFSQLWTKTENKFVYGFIGDNYRRIRIKFINVTKDSAGSYAVYGKSMVGNNKCSFKGSIVVSNVRKYKSISYGVDNEYKSKGIVGNYTIIGEYILIEDNAEPFSGVFSGVFKTDFYLTKDNRVHYDNTEMDADGYTNNEFVGIWTDNKTKSIKICNWGDYRVPNSGNLDVGAGEFSPNEKYLPFGWQTLRDANSEKPISIKARKEEQRIWWQ